MLLSYFRTVVVYCVLIAAIRLLGKRQLGQMEPSEFVVTMLIANLASIPMQDSGIPLLAGLFLLSQCWVWSWCCQRCLYGVSGCGNCSVASR